MREFDISTEAWREYDFNGRIYRIKNPVKLFVYPGSTTHRVLDKNGIVHCVPSVGEHGCVLRWAGKDGSPDVSF